MIFLENIISWKNKWLGTDIINWKEGGLNRLV